MQMIVRGCLFSSIILLIAVGIHAQQSMRAPLLKEALAWHDKIRSGQIEILNESQPLFHKDTDRDTFFFSFISEGDSLESFYLAGAGTIKCYDSGIYRTISSNGNIFATHLLKSEAWDRIKELVPYSLAFPGASLRELLLDSSTRILFNPNKDSGFFVERIVHPDSSEKEMTDLHQIFHFTKEAEIASLEIMISIFGGTIRQKYSIRSAKYNSIGGKDIVDSIRTAFPAMPSQTGTEETNITYDTIRDTTCPIPQGTMAPTFEGVTANGDTIKSQALFGSYLLLDFWFSGCAPCYIAKPILKQLQAKYGPFGLKVVGLDPEDKDTAIFDAASKQDGYLSLRVPKSVAESFQVSAYPTFYVLDSSGRIADCPIGIEILESKIASLFSAKTFPNHSAKE